MKVITIVGMTKRGKSSRAKDLARKAGKPIFCYDVNREWGVKSLPNLDDFLEQATQKRNTTIVFEEATIFFASGRNADKMKELVVRVRHTGNNIILLFHSLADCPKYILRLSNWLVLFRTADNYPYLKATFGGQGDVLEAFLKVQKYSDINYGGPNFHYSTEIRIN